MQPMASISCMNCRFVDRLSRPGFLIAALVVLVGLSLTLVGCSSGEGPVEGVGGNTAVVDEWIKAVNAEDVTQFEKLHTDTAEFHSHLQKNPSIGRQNLWNALSSSNAGSPLQKIYMLDQGDFVCLQVTAANSSSFLYVFRFEGDLIAQVHEYSAVYDLSDVPLFDGADITTDDAGLPERIDTIDSQLDALNERDYSGFIETFNDDAILYVPPSKIPVIGTESITNDVQSFTGNHPTVELGKYRTFGKGNVVCQQVAVENGPMRSLGFVNVFGGSKVSRVYEYLSRAELNR